MPGVAAQERLVDDGSGQKQVRRRLLLKSNVNDADVKKKKQHISTNYAIRM